jgi:hypothetical protein
LPEGIAAMLPSLTIYFEVHFFGRVVFSLAAGQATVAVGGGGGKVARCFLGMNGSRGAALRELPVLV